MSIREVMILMCMAAAILVVRYYSGAIEEAIRNLPWNGGGGPGGIGPAPAADPFVHGRRKKLPAYLR